MAERGDPIQVEGQTFVFVRQVNNQVDVATLQQVQQAEKEKREPFLIHCIERDGKLFFDHGKS